MKQLCMFLALAAVLLVPALSQKGNSPFAGRWDITVSTQTDSYPDWMELVEREGKAEVRIQPRSGNVHPATDVMLDGSHLTLTLTPAAPRAPATVWELTVAGDKLAGTQTRGDATARLAGVRAPELKRDPPAAWTAPEPLFNGKDLTGWEPLTPANNHWVVKDGVLLNEMRGANLKSTRKFDDFKLHIEYNCPDDGNSGIYLRGRYEVQVEYEPVGDNSPVLSMGSIYGFLAPSVALPRKPGQWESYDVTLVGRRVTVVRNGVTIHDNQEIPGITGGALDGNEGEPGPFYLQGDHTGGMQYRNITVSLPRR